MTTPVEDTFDDVLPMLSRAEASTTITDLSRTLEAFSELFLSPDRPATSLELVFAGLVTSRSPELRAAAADLLEPHLPSTWARDLICALSIDPDDIVCMQAMRVAGRNGLDEVTPYLLQIIGPPSQTIDVSISPVGRGAAIARSALLSLLCVTDEDGPELMRRREVEAEAGLALKPLESEPPRGYDDVGARDWLVENLMPADGSMALVPGGTYPIGLSNEKVPDRRFAWQRSTPVQQVWIPPFLVDRIPVTVAPYDRWSGSEVCKVHTMCHAREPDDKDHRRNTLLDPRVAEDHPVTGVDWFDAVAYARAHGKDLATEFQWEAAARGINGSVWGWGDEWTESGVSFFNSSFGVSHDVSLSEWRKYLASTARDYPATTTQPVWRDDAPVSAAGARDMVGNCWEWTRTELHGRGPYSPSIADRRAGATSVVLKGGCWSSLPGQLYPSFRGQDAPFCRHDEIGFRCVRQIPFAVLRTFISDERCALGRQLY